MAQIKPEYFSELPRYKRLRKLRQYFESKQYDGRADFFTGRKSGSSEIVPLRERKPCIIYPLPKNAVNQVVRFTFGESRFPSVSVEPIDRKKSVAGERLNKSDAKELESFISELIESCNLKPLMRRMMRPGLAVGTCPAILSLKRGRIDVQLANAEDMLVEFRNGDPTEEPLRATWSYQYTSSVAGDKGQPIEKRFWFRQDITDQEFIEYEPAEYQVGKEPNWRVSRTVLHGFGFCPVVWARNADESDSRDIDGSSLYDELFDEFDALNFALSQRHRGINFWGTPQPWETGVEEDDGPSPVGRTSHGYSPSDPGEEPPHGRVLGADGRPAVPVSPDNKWTYRSDKAKIGLLETTGQAFEAGTKHVNDIRSRALEAMGVVLVNVSEVMGRTQHGQMSAKFLELAYEPLLALVDEMRHTWWPQGLRAVINMALRIVVARNGEGIYLPGAARVAKILKRFLIDTTDGQLWLSPKMTPVWGDYFSAGPEEIEKGVQTAKVAKESGLVTDADARKYVLPYFGRNDTAEALEEFEGESQDKPKPSSHSDGDDNDDAPDDPGDDQDESENDE